MAMATRLAAADSRQLQKGRRKKLLSAGARSLASSVNKLASKQADNPLRVGRNPVVCQMHDRRGSIAAVFPRDDRGMTAASSAG